MNCVKRVEELLRRTFREDPEASARSETEEAVAQEGLARRMYVWRTIMENRMTRYSAAAVVTLAAALVLLNPFGTSKNSSTVWAEFVENMDKAQMIVHKEQRFFYELDEEEPFLETDVVKHCCQKLGVVEEQYSTEGDLLHRAYVFGKPREVVILLSESKKYFRVPLSDGMARVIDRLTPRGLVEHFRAIEHVELGRSRIDGREVEGFEAVDNDIWPMPDKFRFLFPVKQITWRFWVDVENSLPVRAEYEVITDRGLLTRLKKLRVLCKAYDFEYPQEVREELFEPNIPDDYTRLNLESVARENAAWLGVGTLPIIGVVVYRRRRRRPARGRGKRRLMN